MIVPTVKVKRDGPKGYRIINKSDFDPAKHELFDSKAEKTSTGAADKPLDDMTAAELKDMATEKGLDFPGNVSKAKLIEMLSAG